MRKLYFSQKALSDIQQVFAYLDANWPEKVRLDFQEEFSRTLQILQNTPTTFPQSDLDGILKAVVTKHNSILYSFDDSEIRIMSVFDNRLHPKKRRK